MKEIRRYDINENWAHSGIIQAGDYCFINYCVRNIGGTIEVQMNCLFKNIWDIPVMEKVIKRRFNGKYPVRKSFQTGFANPGNLFFQVDAIAYSTINS